MGLFATFSIENTKNYDTQHNSVKYIYAECRYAGWRIFIVMLGVIKRCVIMRTAIMPSVI
jgi:hypothetical protein